MKPKILVVDDDSEIFEILSDLLADEGFEVLWAKSAEEFRQKTLAQKPDLILLDVMLGSKNGPEAYKKMLADGFDSRVPVIFISGLLQNDWADPPMRPGRRYAMHAKPFKFDRLLSDIRFLTSAA